MVENIRICCGDHTSRWSLIQSYISLAQVCDCFFFFLVFRTVAGIWLIQPKKLMKTIDLVLSRVTEAAKPIKGKKKPIQLSAFIADLRNEIQDLKNTGIAELNKRLDAVGDEDEIKWDCLGSLFGVSCFMSMCNRHDG